MRPFSRSERCHSSRLRQKFQALKRECGHLACCAGSVAWGAGKGKLFREAGIFGGYLGEVFARVWGGMVARARGEGGGGLRAARASLSLSHASAVRAERR